MGAAQTEVQTIERRLSWLLPIAVVCLAALGALLSARWGEGAAADEL